MKQEGKASVIASSDTTAGPAAGVAEPDRAEKEAAARPVPGPAVGMRMPDGTVYAGLSPETRKPLYVPPEDAPMIYTLPGAIRYALQLEAHGHKDWRVPGKEELDLLYKNRAAVGGFDESGGFPSGWYWSCTERRNYEGWSQRFTDGEQSYNLKFLHSRLRCVRTGQ
jgi:hypothetical protein